MKRRPGFGGKVSHRMQQPYTAVGTTCGPAQERRSPRSCGIRPDPFAPSTPHGKALADDLLAYPHDA
ncbi:hypothetical protein ACP70R_013298 [Stipagrostis hirtigluma subsp. patula]